MSKQSDSYQERRFAAATLPWLVAAGALLLYLVTLNKWLSFSNMVHVAKVAGWTWQAEFNAPLFMAVTYPFRWLPSQYAAFALNLFAVICACLTLALLARSAALLPHDRTVAQRERERSEYGTLSIPLAWAPPLLAVLVCGLQLSFWENATNMATSPGFSSSGHIFDLLLFAYVIRCILEYRIDERYSWIARAALVLGLGITNDWAMLGFLPLFAISLLWIRGMEFFNPAFLVRTVAWGAIGLSFYLLLPIVFAFIAEPHNPFWFILKSNIGSQFYYLKVYWAQKQLLVVLGMTSLLPVLFMGIRWSSYFGDTSRTGALLAKVVFHIVHGFFLIAGIWIALDPPVSPRNQNLGVPFLSFYYLGALAVGYMAGYFLLVFGPKRASRSGRTISSQLKLVHNLVLAVICLIMIAAPVALLALNFPRIRVANGPALREFAMKTVDALPNGPCIVLSDDPRRTLLAIAAVAGTPREKDDLFIDTQFLRHPFYHQKIREKFPQWPATIGADNTRPVEDLEILSAFSGLATSNHIAYLHHSFGFFFELFYQEPHGLVYLLKEYAKNAVTPPRLSEALIQENEKFWDELSKGTLPELTRFLDEESPQSRQSFGRRLMDRAHLKPKPHSESVYLGTFYSKALNVWGTMLQQQDMFDKATPRYELARKLNNDNVVAKINLQYNQRYLTNSRIPLTLSKDVSEEFGKFRSFDQVLRHNGPYEEPGMCFSQGVEFQKGSLPRQAAQQFTRARTLCPEYASPTLALANLYVQRQDADPALELLNELKTSASANDPTNLPALVLVSTAAHLLKKDRAGAQAVVDDALQRADRSTNAVPLILESAAVTFTRAGEFEDALPIVNKLLAINPDNTNSLANKGYICMRLGRYEEAVPALTRALELGQSSQEFAETTRFNRAIANLHLKKLEPAEEDYRAVLAMNENYVSAYFGLGEIAMAKGNTNAAVEHFRRYLERAPNDTDEAKSAMEKLKKLAPESQ